MSDAVLILHRIVTPADHDNRSVEVCLSAGDGALWWSVRIDAWDSVIASSWHPLDDLARVPAALDLPSGSVALAAGVEITPGDGFDVRVRVTAGDGVTATAVADRRNLAHAVRALLDRVREDADFLAGLG